MADLGSPPGFPALHSPRDSCVYPVPSDVELRVQRNLEGRVLFLARSGRSE